MKDTLNFKPFYWLRAPIQAICSQYTHCWGAGKEQGALLSMINVRNLIRDDFSREGWQVAQPILRVGSLKHFKIHRHKLTLIHTAKLTKVMLLVSVFSLLAACGPQYPDTKADVMIVKQKPHTHQYYWRCK